MINYFRLKIRNLREGELLEDYLTKGYISWRGYQIFYKVGLCSKTTDTEVEVGGVGRDGSKTSRSSVVKLKTVVTRMKREFSVVYGLGHL